MKLRHLHIEDYKMFKDFDISFVDENDEALPIVVLAGVNGSGKTTLLEFIDTYQKKPYQKNSYIQVFRDNTEVENLSSVKEVESLPSSSSIMMIDEPELSLHPNLHLFNKSETSINQIVYFSTDINIQNIKDFLPNYIENVMYEENLRPKEVAHRIRNIFNNVLQDMKMGIEFEGRNGRKELFFRNKNDGTKFTIDELSTGEKTLMSKVLYLYLADIKDKVILIDEPELSLHPAWQNRVLKIYENFAIKNNCQIIIATHSPHIIASAKNEYLRILRKKEDGSIEVINDLKAHGRDINSILFDVMGEVAYRPREFDNKIDRLHIAIDDRKMEEAQERLEELKKDYGEDDDVVMEAQMLIDMFSRDEK